MADFGERAGRYGSSGGAGGEAVQRAPGKRSLVEARYGGVQRKASAAPAAVDVNKDPDTLAEGLGTPAAASEASAGPAAAPAEAAADESPATPAAAADAKPAAGKAGLGPQSTAGPGGDDSTPKPSPRGDVGGGTDTNAPPVAQYVIPFDTAPKSAPGEQILFAASYTHATPGDYKLVYTSAGGHFGSQGSKVTTKTIAGLKASNVGWFIDSKWDGKTALTAKLEVQKTDGTVVATTSWTFSKKPYQPTTIAQQEGEGEQANPAVYSYKLGPGKGSGDAYIGFTILEKFTGPYSTNLKLADIKPDYAKQNGLGSDAAVATHFFPGTGDNGTFTASAGDMIYDQHGGMAGADQAKAQLVAPKPIEKHLTQTYESDPGVVLGTYTITRVMKLDGSRAITKKKV